MTQISQKNVALISIVFIIIGTAVNATISAVIPQTSLLFGVAGLFIIIGCFGFLVSYYCIAVNLWNSGNMVGAVVFLSGPIIVASFLTSGLPLTNTVEAAYAIGRIGLRRTVIISVVLLWFGAQIQNTIIKGMSTRSPLEPADIPSTLVLGAFFFCMSAVLFIIM